MKTKSPNIQTQKRSGTFVMAWIASAYLLFVMAFQWSLMESFLFGLLILAQAWLLMFGMILCSAYYAYKHRRLGKDALSPLAICLVTTLLVIVVPFTRIWINANYYLKKNDRETVVRQIIAGELKPNIAYNKSLIALPRGRNLSSGGNHVIFREYDGKPYIFFFTFRGVLDNYSGFLWVPKSGRPENFLDAGEKGTEIKQFDSNWYFIGHH